MRTLEALRTPVALAALVSVAALAPTPAMAFDDNPGATECRAPRAGDTVIWNNSQLCAVEQGSGGGGGTGAAGSAPGGRQGPEIIWASSDAPRDQLADCLRHNPLRCLSNQLGGRRSEIGEGDGRSNPREPKGRGGRPAGKRQAETPKETKPKPASVRTCRAIADTLIKLEYVAVLQYKNSRMPRSELSPNPFRYDPDLASRISQVDGAIAQWRNGGCASTLPGALRLGI